MISVTAGFLGFFLPINSFGSPLVEKKLSEPWFSLIKLKIKKVEGRLNKGDFANMNIADDERMLDINLLIE